MRLAATNGEVEFTPAARGAARADPAGWTVGAGFAAILTLVGWLRHRNGWSGALDLGIFDQGVWLLSEGLAPEVTINGHNLFADHLSPILLLVVPLYWLAATPMWLVAVQSISLGAGVPAIRRFARHHGANVVVSTVAWLVAAPLLAGAMFDAHPSTMAVGPLMWLLVAIDGDRRWPVVLFALVIAFCRADLGWVVAATAVVAPVRHRRILLGVGIATAVLGYLVPSLVGSVSTFPVHYGHLGDSPGDLVRHPWRVVHAFGIEDVRTYVIWLLSGGFLVLAAPRWAIAIAVAGLPILLSQWPGTEDPFFHYGAPLVPLVLAGSICGMVSGKAWAKLQYFVGGAVAATLLAGPISPKAPDAVSIWQIGRPRFADDQLATALAAVPDGAPVAAVNRVLSHLSQRELAYGWPIPFETTDLAVLYGGADPEAAAAIRVVIAEPEDREKMEDLGFEVEDLGDLLIGRR